MWAEDGELCVSSDWTVCPPGLSSSLMLKVKRGVFADVGGINGSSSSVNMNRVWHLVRSFLLSEGRRSGTRTRLQHRAGPLGPVLSGEEEKTTATDGHVYTHIHVPAMIRPHKQLLIWITVTSVYSISWAAFLHSCTLYSAYPDSHLGAARCNRCNLSDTTSI